VAFFAVPVVMLVCHVRGRPPLPPVVPAAVVSLLSGREAVLRACVVSSSLSHSAGRCDDSHDAALADSNDTTLRPGVADCAVCTGAGQRVVRTHSDCELSRRQSLRTGDLHTPTPMTDG
jgi:hypothetical protein